MVLAVFVIFCVICLGMKTTLSKFKVDREGRIEGQEDFDLNNVVAGRKKELALQTQKQATAFKNNILQLDANILDAGPGKL